MAPKHGIIVEKYDVNQYAEAMEKLANNKEEMKKMANNARKKSDDYSYEKILKKWELMFNSI